MAEGATRRLRKKVKKQGSTTKRDSTSCACGCRRRKRVAGGDGEGVERQSLRDSGHGQQSSFQPAGVSAVSPHEDDRRAEQGKGKDKMEKEFVRVFGESADEVVERERQGDVGEEAARSRAGKAEID